jgi:hypothetical protein
MYSVSEDVIYVHFNNFGLGSEKTSDFRLEMSWDDFESLFKLFVLQRNPKATSWLRARSLATAARRAGWRPDK